MFYTYTLKYGYRIVIPAVPDEFLLDSGNPFCFVIPKRYPIKTFWYKLYWESNGYPITALGYDRSDGCTINLLHALSLVQPFDFAQDRHWQAGSENLVSLCRVRKPCLSVDVKILGDRRDFPVPLYMSLESNATDSICYFCGDISNGRIFI